MAGQITIEKQRVNPSKAKSWLERNDANRPCKEGDVKRLAAAMAGGKWKLNGDAIRFNGDGTLIDGQHRLRACIESGCSFDTYVVTNLDNDAFDTIDQGRKRSIADVFARQGFSNAALSAAVRVVWRFKRGYGAKGVGMRPDEANDILQGSPGLTDAVETARSLCGRKKLISPGALAALIFLTRKKVRLPGGVPEDQMKRSTPAYHLTPHLCRHGRKNVL